MVEYQTNTESIYNGGFSGLDPNSSEYFIGGFENGKRMNAAYLGQSMNPATPDQLGETVKTIKSGTGVIEVQALGIQGDTDQAIPKQHFKEMRAIMKLSGVKPSLHGPIIDPVGLTKNGLNDAERIGAERRFSDVMEKANLLDNDGNIPVVFHASAGYPGTLVWKRNEDGKLEKDESGKLIPEYSHVINQENGQMTSIKDSKVFKPGPTDREGQLLDKDGNLEGYDFLAKDKLGSINRTEWDNQLVRISELSKQAREVIGDAAEKLVAYERSPILGQTERGLAVLDPITKKPTILENQDARSAYKNIERADQFLENAELAFDSAFETAFKYGSDDQRKELVDFSKEYKKAIKSLGVDTRIEKKKKRVPTPFTPIEKAEIIDTFSNKLRKITTSYEEGGKIIRREPQLFTKVEDFAIKKAAETFGNVAFDAYDKYGEKAPVIALENIDPERGAISTGAQLKQVVQQTRDNLAEHLHKEKKISRKNAEKIAEKLVGATWDVGHLNQQRKYGATEPELIAQTREVAKMIKHVHLTDNFGYADTHLVPGMGNVPIKEHLEELEKAGVLSKVKSIVEAGGWSQMTKSSSHPAALRAFGSPIYGMSHESGGYWNQAQGTFGGYFGGYGNINPQTHHSIYGAGLTTLPMELGGNIPGGGSRFSGNSMA